MIKTTTPNEVILNVYNETSEKLQRNFHTECILNSFLSSERDEFECLKQSLDQLSFQPKQKSIEAIINYSASFMGNH